MRITGLATGLDMDSLVTESMRPYRIKIQQTQQKQEILEIKQKLYRDIVKDSREFYDKHLDVTKTDSILFSKNWSSIKFSSSDEQAVTVNGLAGAVNENYSVNVKQLAETAKGVISIDSLVDNATSTNKVDEITLTYNGGADSVKIDIKGKTSQKEIVDAINNKLKEEKITGFNVKYSEFSKGIIVESEKMGAAEAFTITVGSNDIVATGKDALVEITNSNGTYIHSANTNKVVLDNVEFNFNATTKTGEPARIVGKKDITDIKDKLVNFINDYNTLMEKMNKLTMEKRNSSYMPLTDEQKSELSENEIKLWNEKVEKGQLNRDSDITRIVNSMKKAMSSLVDGVGGNLEKFGITPSKEYNGTKSGTFTIDEDKLSKALENNTEELMNLFISQPPKDSNLTSSEEYSKTGILYRLKDTLYKEVVTGTASIIKKAGLEGTSSSTNNELSKSIQKYKNKIKDLETDFSRREQQLYTKWATVEKMMNNLNSQQSYLVSQLG